MSISPAASVVGCRVVVHVALLCWATGRDTRNNHNNNNDISNSNNNDNDDNNSNLHSNSNSHTNNSIALHSITACSSHHIC